MILGKLLEETTKKYPDGEFIIYQNTKIKYKDFNNSVNKLANALLNLGIEKGDRVAIIYPNSPEFVISYFAIIKIGAIVVPLNWGYKKREVEYILKNSGSKAILAGSRSKELLKCLEIPKIKIISQDIDKNFYSLEKIMEDSSNSFILPEISPEDVACIIYTAATNGFPKGAMLTHSNLFCNVEESAKIISGTKEEIFVGVLPLFHAFGATTNMILPIYLGAKTILIEKFLPDKLLETITKEKPTIFTGVPTMFYVLAITQTSFEPDLSSIRWCISGGAPLPDEVVKNFEERFKITLLEGFGITECSPVICFNYLKEKRKIGSIGLPYPSAEIKIFDENDKEVPTGEEGEMVVKGPMVMKGYYNNEEETKEATRSGYFHTGDLAKCDEDGYIYITGRKKKMLIFAGFNVYYKEVENVLLSHPDIDEAKVEGFPDPIYGEIPKAKIKRKEGAVLTEKEIINFCKENLANYKVPRIIEFH